MVHLQFLILIINFFKQVESKIIKILVCISYSLFGVSILNITYTNNITILSYIVLFISIIMLTKEKILCDSNKAFKPLKFIAIIFGIICIILSILYLTSSLEEGLSFLMMAFITISASCFEMKGFETTKKI